MTPAVQPPKYSVILLPLVFYFLFSVCHYTRVLSLFKWLVPILKLDLQQVPNASLGHSVHNVLIVSAARFDSSVLWWSIRPTEVRIQSFRGRKEGERERWAKAQCAQCVL